MSPRPATLEVRITRALSLRMERHGADPARSYSRTYWTASLHYGAGLKPKHVAFAHSDERAPRTSFDEDWPDVVSVWIGGTSFEAPIAQRARIDEWIAANNSPQDSAPGVGAAA